MIRELFYSQLPSSEDIRTIISSVCEKPECDGLDEHSVASLVLDGIIEDVNFDDRRLLKYIVEIIKNYNIEQEKKDTLLKKISNRVEHYDYVIIMYSIKGELIFDESDAVSIAKHFKQYYDETGMYYFIVNLINKCHNKRDVALIFLDQKYCSCLVMSNLSDYDIFFEDGVDKYDIFSESEHNYSFYKKISKHINDEYLKSLRIDWRIGEQIKEYDDELIYFINNVMDCESEHSLDELIGCCIDVPDIFSFIDFENRFSDVKNTIIMDDIKKGEAMMFFRKINFTNFNIVVKKSCVDFIKNNGFMSNVLFNYVSCYLLEEHDLAQCMSGSDVESLSIYKFLFNSINEESLIKLFAKIKNAMNIANKKIIFTDALLLKKLHMMRFIEHNEDILEFSPCNYFNFSVKYIHVNDESDQGYPIIKIIYDDSFMIKSIKFRYHDVILSGPTFICADDIKN